MFLDLKPISGEILFFSFICPFTSKVLPENKNSSLPSLLKLAAREQLQQLPDMRDLHGAAAGLGRIYSYYGPNLMAETKLGNSLAEDFLQLDAFDLAVIAQQSINQEELLDAGIEHHQFYYYFYY